MSQPAPAVALPTETAPPRWIAPWLAFLAPLYVISPIALLALPQLRKLPVTAKWILAFYALSQQLPALFTPEPLLASLLALGRTLLMFGLIGVGVALGNSERLKPFAIGLSIVFVTAIVFFIFTAQDITSLRLTHPYITSTGLGLAGAIGIWFALFNIARIKLQISLGTLSLGILLFSGSRSALISVIFATVVTYLTVVKDRKTYLVIGIFIFFVTSLYIGQRYEIASIKRFTSIDTTDRDIIWSDTLSVLRQHPLSGIGSYLLGKELSPTPETCKLLPSIRGQAGACPAWVVRLGSPWLIAHNIILQQLVETGPVGLAGLLSLLGFMVANSISGRNPFAISVIIGLLVSSVLDNTVLVPSQVSAELFWVVGGIQLKNSNQPRLFNVFTSIILISCLSLPFFGSFIRIQSVPVTFKYFSAKKIVSTPIGYLLRVQYDIPIGNYRANLRSCASSCATLITLPFQVGDQGAEILNLNFDLRSIQDQTLELRLYPGKSSLSSEALAIYTWNVELK